jgi:hypothetical protein
MKKCYNCGYTTENDWQFICSICGESLTKLEDNEQAVGQEEGFPASEASAEQSAEQQYYNPSQQGYNNPQGYNPMQQGYNPAGQGFNSNQQGYNPMQQGYNPAGQGNNNQQGYQGQPNQIFQQGQMDSYYYNMNSQKYATLPVVFGIVGIILAILNLIFPFVHLIGLGFGAAAISISIQKKRQYFRGTTAGLVLGIIAVAFAIFDIFIAVIGSMILLA